MAVWQQPPAIADSLCLRIDEHVEADVDRVVPPDFDPRNESPVERRNIVDGHSRGADEPVNLRVRLEFADRDENSRVRGDPSSLSERKCYGELQGFETRP